MTTTAHLARPGRRARQAARVALSLAAAGAMAYLLLISVVLAAVRCGDGCGGPASADHWRWTAQLLLALVGVAAGGTALLLGFTSRVRTYRALVAISATCLGAWLLWVVGFGAF